MVRAKYAVFAVIAVVTGYVLYHNERFLIEPDHPLWEHYGSVGWWLVPHGIAGAGSVRLNAARSCRMSSTPSRITRPLSR